MSSFRKSGCMREIYPQVPCPMYRRIIVSGPPFRPMGLCFPLMETDWKIKQRTFILGWEETFAIYFFQGVSSLLPYSSRMAVPGESPYLHATSSFTAFPGHQCWGPLSTRLGTPWDVYKQRAIWQARNSTLLWLTLQVTSLTAPYL